MENRVRFPIMVLRIEIRPEESSESLEKLLLKIHGVYEVAINREEQKVTILGDINPLKVVKYIAKMGKRAELLVYDKKPKIDAPNPDHKTKTHGSSRQYGHVHHHPHCNATNDYNYEPSSSAKDADRREQHSAHNNDKHGGKKKVEEEEEDQEFFHSVPPPNNDHQHFHGRTRNADYEYAHEPANFQFHEAKFEEEIKEAKRDMNRFFSGAAGSSAYHHHHQMPRPNYSHWTRDHQHYGDRNHPRPPAPRRVYSARPGTHYDKFTNFFSDENPSSCTII